MSKLNIAVILGTGTPRGVGGALGRRFAEEGLHVIATGRNLEKVQLSVDGITEAGGSAEAMQVDVTEAADQDKLFAAVAKKGALKAVLYNAGGNQPIAFEKLTPAMFEEFWRIGCFGAFLTAQRALPLLTKQQGSLFFTGASASLRGKPMFAHFASAKAGLRNLVQALARQYGPEGVHVAHVIIDGVVDGDSVRSRFKGYIESLGEESALNPDAVADAFWMLHKQQRSAWTHELDLRPHKENW